MEQKDINDLQFASYNPRSISKEDFASLKRSIEKFGDLSGIVRNETTNNLIGGHQRIRAFQQLHNPTIIIDERFEQPNSVGTIARGHVLLGDEKFGYREVQWSLEFEQAANIAANRIQGEFDKDLLAELVYELNNMNPELLELTGQSQGEIDALLKSVGALGDDEEHGNLADKFIVPPFSILDTRQGYWQSRARAWSSKMGDVSATREGVLGLKTFANGNYDYGNGMRKVAGRGVSELDPVLCEVAYRWFTPNQSATVFNPFGGEPVSAFVAAWLGYYYAGTEIREEQVRETYNKINTLNDDQKALVNLQVGDARNCAQIFEGVKSDLIFSSPPFYDLEVYSDRPDDMSNLGTYDEFMDSYRQAFTGAVGMLKDNRFVCINVTEIRDKAGAYRNFVGDNVKLFTDLGLTFYNDLIIVNVAGTAAIRAAKYMGSRKVARVHQNLLIFYKGDITKIKDIFPALTSGVDFAEEQPENETPNVGIELLA